MSEAHEGWSFNRPISLGASCPLAYNLNRFYGLSHRSFFDWWYSPLVGLNEFLFERDPELLVKREYLTVAPLWGGTDVLNTKYNFHYTHQFTKLDGTKNTGGELAEGWDGADLDYFARITRRLWEFFLGLDDAENRIVFFRLRHQDDSADVNEVKRLHAALSQVFTRASFRIALLNYPQLETQADALGPDFTFLRVNHRQEPDWRGPPAEWDAALSRLPFGYRGSASPVQVAAPAAPAPPEPLSTEPPPAAAPPAEPPPTMSTPPAPSVGHRTGLFAFRSLGDGRIDGAPAGFVGEARHYAPELIATTETTGNLSAYHLFCANIEQFAQNDELWGRIDRSIVDNFFQPGSDFLVVDNTWEGEEFNPAAFAAFHAELDRRRIPADTVAVITTCQNMPGFYKDWANGQDLARQLVVYSYLSAGFYMTAHINRSYGTEEDFRAQLDGVGYQLYTGLPREYRYLCLNNIVKPWRLSLAMLLREHFPEQSLVSFGKIPADEAAFWAGVVAPWAAKGPGSLEQRVEGFASQTPLILDVETGSVAARQQAETLISPELYWRSSMSIVAESDMSSQGRLRVTEKLVKPLGLFHPFILAGNRGALRVLRGEGFRTFHPFIDESYDDIEDGCERLFAVQREIMRIGVLPPGELACGIRSLAENLIHNACYLRYAYDRVKWTHINDVLQRMAQHLLRYRSDAASEPLPAIDAKASPRPAAAATAVIGNIAEVELDPADGCVAVKPGPAFDAQVTIFLHLFYSDGDWPSFEPRNYQFPAEADRLAIPLPERPVQRIIIGQFTAETKLWQATLVP